ncbi:MAG: hypothetical protein WDW38_003784 [Sanguina aurantia]
MAAHAAGAESAAGASGGAAMGAYIDAGLHMDGAAAGPLSGLTFAVKDLFDVAGHVTGFGSPTWLRHTLPLQPPPLQSRWANLRGKTHMDELAYSLNGENVHYGTPVNPAAPGRVPGGSSSGSAVAVAAGNVTLSLGSDTGGSVRIPASYVGSLGMRPTHGRISLAGGRPLAPSFDTVGWFARDASVLRAAGHVLLGTPMPPIISEDQAASEASTEHTDAASGSSSGAAAEPTGQENHSGTAAAPAPAVGQSVAAAFIAAVNAGEAKPTCRWLVGRDAFDLADSSTGAAIYDALSVDFEKIMGILGRPTEIDIAHPLADQQLGSLASWLEVFRVCQAYEVWQEHGEWVSNNSPGFGPGISQRFTAASKITKEQAEAAGAQRATITAHMLTLLGKDGILSLPTAPGPAPLLQSDPATLEDWRKRMISLTCIAGLAGLPQVSLPVGFVEGCPVGLSLIGPPGSDESLLLLAERIMTVVKQQPRPDLVVVVVHSK